MYILWARRLAVSFREMNRGGFEPAGLLRTEDEDDFEPGRKHLEIPVHLRMLDIEPNREKVHLNDNKGNDPPAAEVPSAEHVLAAIVVSDEGSLEGLTVPVGGQECW